MAFLEQLLSSLGAALSVTVLLVGSLFGNHSISFSNTTTSVKILATTTFSVPVATSSPITLPQIQTITSSKKGVATASSSGGSSSEQAPSPNAPQIAGPSISPEALNTETRSAVVNILCTTKAGGSFEPISGSGVIIDPRGVILTNAHVAQFFLLRNYSFPGNIQCLIRTGSPAQNAYTAELLYLPSAWVAANASQITEAQETGTGENDYAFLLITGSINPDTPLPQAFPYLPLYYGNEEIGDEMLLASYPAGFLDGITIQNDLYLTSAYASVTALYIFQAGEQWVDLFSVPGSVISQSGSSGGAAVRASDGTLAGIITTESIATSTSQRDLRAISIQHIEHTLGAAGMGTIQTLLSGDIAQKALDFNENEAPSLTGELVQALNATSSQ